MTGAPGQAKRLAIFTICSNNYLPFARSLFESARMHHPEAALFLCLADTADGQAVAGVTVVEAAALGIADFASFAFRYDIMEFNTALKPTMFLHLLAARGFDQVIYLDPDIEIFSPMSGVSGALDLGASFVLTPHLCSPSEGAVEPNDIAIMRAGTFNLGFLGASAKPGALELIRWWARRLRLQCVNAQAEGLFVDQKFIDLLPSFAPDLVIDRDTSLNAAYWNLGQRDLGRSETGWTVDGRALSFFHFSGYNPSDTSRLSKHDPRFAGDLAEPLRRLLEEYSARLVRHGYGAGPAAPYAYGRFASGAAIPAVVRAMFREEVDFGDGDPFAAFEAQLDEPAPGAPAGVGGERVTRLMAFLARGRVGYDGPGLEEGAMAASALVRWFVADGVRQAGLDPALVEAAARRLAGESA